MTIWSGVHNGSNNFTIGYVPSKDRCCLHSALGYKLREEFEQQLESTATFAGATMSVFRHGEDYRPDGPHATRSGSQTAPRTISFDEIPAGYSLASCSPAQFTESEKQ